MRIHKEKDNRQSKCNLFYAKGLRTVSAHGIRFWSSHNISRSLQLYEHGLIILNDIAISQNNILFNIRHSQYKKIFNFFNYISSNIN